MQIWNTDMGLDMDIDIDRDLDVDVKMYVGIWTQKIQMCTWIWI